MSYFFLPGRDVFERVLANFPKRLDVWTLYVDQLVAGKFHRNDVLGNNLNSKNKEFSRKQKVETLFSTQTLTLSSVTAGNIEGARGVLDRATGLVLGAAKMRTLFKKFLAFEKAHGDESQEEKVKRKAAEFVEKKRSELLNAGDDDAEAAEED